MVEVAAIMMPIVILALIFIFVLLMKIVKAFASRGASRQELRELHVVLKQLQDEITEIRSQLADIIIILDDRK